MDILTLKRLLQSAKIQPASPTCPPFMLATALDQVLNYETVLSVLHDPAFESVQPYQKEDAAQVIMREGRKAFAVLVEADCTLHLPTFIEEGLLSALPIADDVLQNYVSADESRRFQAAQAQYNVHVFRRGKWMRKIPKTARLPYVKQERIGAGGFSTVWSVDICSQAQEFVRDAKGPTVSLVRKELTTRAQAVRSEADLLFLLGSIRHPNVVELLDAYVVDGVTNLIFPRADSDLACFLHQHTRPVPFEDDFAVLHGMSGLAAGLATLHDFADGGSSTGHTALRRFRGYHHDIKPANVLVRGSLFILADFGLAQVTPIVGHERSDDTKTAWKIGTAAYGAPECRDLSTFEPGLVGRAVDVWSFGCITAELAVHVAGRAQAVAGFREQQLCPTPFGSVQCFHDGQSLSTTVSEFMQRVEDESAFSSVQQWLCCSRRMLSRDPRERPRAQDVESQLCRISIGSLTDRLLELIQDKTFSSKAQTHDINLFRTLHSIEQCRLRAWSMTLAFATDDPATKSEDLDQHTLSFFYKTLRDAYDLFESHAPFEAADDVADSRLRLLRKTNEELCAHLPSSVRTSVDNTFYILTAHQTPQKCAQQAELLDAGDQEISDPEAVAAMKYMSLKIGRSPTATSTHKRIEESLMTPAKEKIDPTQRPPVWHYSYGHRPDMIMPVLVEFSAYWKTLPSVGEQAGTKLEDRIETMFERVAQLVSMIKSAQDLPRSRILPCLGTFHAPNRKGFGLVYTFPNTTVPPIRLNKLMRHSKDDSPITPDPAEKLNLAKQLVLAVQSFHTSGWIHKSLSSLNILFFPDAADDPSSIDLTRPYLIGFDHSRPGGGGEYTKAADQLDAAKEYQHPLYRNGISGARRVFDYYSLGLVLLEVGLWTSISAIHSSSRYQRYNADQLRLEYIKLSETTLKLVMGPRYQTAVKMCLEFPPVDGDKEQQLHFQRTVVDRLNECGSW